MFLNYVIHFNMLSQQEKFEQLFIILSFFVILFSICMLLLFLKFKFLNKTKNSSFKKFLKKI